MKIKLVLFQIFAMSAAAFAQADQAEKVTMDNIS